MDIVKNENEKDLYEKYSDIVINYQNALNEAKQIEIKYNIEFGLLEIKKFKVSIEVIKLKKMLSYIITLKNRGLPINVEEVKQYVEDEMTEYQIELKDLLDKVDLAKKSHGVLSEDERKIKKMFYKIAKLIHPDLHPEYELDEEIMELWQKAMFYYNMYDLESLEQVYDAVTVKVKDKTVTIDVPTMENKINEYEERIEKIKSSNPYLLNKFLKNEIVIDAHRTDIEAEIESFNTYIYELQEEVDRQSGGNSYVQ